ncbi:hypothetical protein QTG54_011486 [Skeletonema marinoi]|uniref:Uncharacterized protein n=1 Tax=Skeletonema marinoi TaxID=267567 RepID=A0AAD9D9G2_9STRA|nr:hypothetical protein QTG54_011486 [Skeletonema marinoi]
MKQLFLALTLVANLHAPANAADLLVAAVADNINANADLLIEAVAAADADDVDADDINATPSQVDFNNQVDETKTMHKFLRGIIPELNPGCVPTFMRCTSNSNANQLCQYKEFDGGKCLDGLAYCCSK